MTRIRSSVGNVLLCVLAAAAAQGVAAQGAGPDVIVGDLYEIRKFGTVGGITSYAVGTDSCNVGDQPLTWVAETSDHPVIAQNVYRLENGRFEQIGMSWLKHGFAALALDTCSNDCVDPGTTTLLGVNCSDPYSATLNGDQDGFGGLGGLGPRSEVDAATGQFPFPYTGIGATGDAIFRRLQVANADLSPLEHPDASYFVEAHYVTPQDAAAGNGGNNASHRPLLVGGLSGGGRDLFLTGQTRREEPAIFAWADQDAQVELQEVVVAGQGRLWVGSRCTDNGDGTWHYEYAVANLDLHRAVRRFSVPLAGAAPLNAGFHDVDYHSGEPYDGTDWPVSVVADALEWSTSTFAADSAANALRWSTLYNFRFDAAAPAQPGQVALEPYRPGLPAELAAAACVPCDSSSAVDADGDGFVACSEDCDDDDPNNWIACATCRDADGDGWWTGCDDYLTIDGPDCDDTNPSRTDSCCPAITLLAGARQAERGLATLREFRDRVLLEDESGRRWVGAYYRHAAQANAVLLRDPRLSARALALLQAVLPRIEATSAGATLSVEAGELREVLALLEAMAAAADRELAATLRRLGAAIESGELTRRLGIEIQSISRNASPTASGGDSVSTPSSTSRP